MLQCIISDCAIAVTQFSHNDKLGNVQLDHATPSNFFFTYKYLRRNDSYFDLNENDQIDRLKDPRLYTLSSSLIHTYPLLSRSLCHHSRMMCLDNIAYNLFILHIKTVHVQFKYSMKYRLEYYFPICSLALATEVLC